MIAGSSAPGRRGLGASAGLAAGLAAVAGLLAACAAHGPGLPQRAAGPAHRWSAASSPAAGFRVLSMTFVSDQRGFALGTVPCGHARCAALLGTRDGGTTWRRLAAPTTKAADFDTCAGAGPCVGQVRFATPSIGYAFGPSLFVTADGGRSWHRMRGAYVSSLEAAGGTAIRVASKAPGCSGAPGLAQMAPIGSTTWRTLQAPPIYLICPPVLYRQGARVLLVGYGNAAGGVRATAQIDRSADSGRTWRRGTDRCGGKDGYAAAVALAPPHVLVELCRHQMPRPDGSYGPAWLRISVNDGVSFGPGRVIPTLARTAKGFIVSYQIAAASSGRLVVTQTGTRGSVVLLSTDGGRSWSPRLRTRSAAPVLLVGFEDPMTGRIAQAGVVWTTRNGGRTWTADRFAAR